MYVDPRFIETSSPVTITKNGRERVSVKLIKNFGFNCIGDVCGFKPDVAKKLVASGAAVYMQAKTDTHPKK